MVTQPGGDPEIISAQIDLFNQENLRAREVIPFEVGMMENKLAEHKDKEILAIDLGGGKLATSFFRIDQGKLVEDSGLSDTHLRSITLSSRDGSGYLDYLKELAQAVSEKRFLVGVSTAGMVRGSVLENSPNLPIFMSEFEANYQKDFAKLFNGDLVVVNDAVAGVCASAIEVSDEHPDIKNIIFVVNGGGIGGAVLANGNVWATEPGHIELIKNLNVMGQEKLCDVNESRFVCIENVAASGAGIEDLWQKQNGENAIGEVISNEFMKGDKLAAGLYDNSARIMAHVILGIAKTFGLLAGKDTAVVMHGGILGVAGYADKVIDHVTKYLGFEVPFLLSNEIAKNLSLQGAAYLTILN
jgi:predicted NBD/HSP70 family sugar kinase